MSKKSLVTREKVELEEKPEEITTSVFEKPIEVKYPDILPTLDDVEVLEYNKNDYYRDKSNNI